MPEQGESPRLYLRDLAIRASGYEGFAYHAKMRKREDGTDTQTFEPWLDAVGAGVIDFFAPITSRIGRHLTVNNPRYRTANSLNQALLLSLPCILDFTINSAFAFVGLVILKDQPPLHKLELLLAARFLANMGIHAILDRKLVKTNIEDP